MERVPLPTDVTVNGREVYFNDKQAKQDESETLPIDRYSKKQRSIKGRAFKQEPIPGKLQRVAETYIYTSDQIREFEMQKYHDQFKAELDKRFEGSSTSELLVCLFGYNSEVSTNFDFVDISKEVEKRIPRTRSKICRNTFSFFLSSWWREKKCLVLFADRTWAKDKSGSRPAYAYNMTDIGLKVGVHELVKIMNQKYQVTLQN
jgi:hypothetical protein